ncbi:MAG: SRPBCC family protein [Phenylobacterium sp.]
MTDSVTHGAFGERIDPAAVRLERMLPGPIERVWAYLTQSDLRGQWLATGDMDLRVGGKVDLTWRNDELTGHKEERPAGVEALHRQQSEVIRVEPPRLLSFGWAGGSDVTFELEPLGDEVRLTVTHRRARDRSQLLGVSAGWHAHLDVLAARLEGCDPQPFWKSWIELRAAYDQRLA